MILAAGFGTRLWPLTEDRTKPAVPFVNRPLVAYSVEYLKAAGIRDIVVNLHHQPESITSALGDGSAFGVELRYSLEHEILGTGGALDKVREWLEGDDFVVVNGKIVTDIDLKRAIDVHRERDALATLVLLPNEQRERFSIVDVTGDGLVSGFGGFPDSEEVAPPVPLMFTGIQVMSPGIFDYIPRGRFSHTTTDVFPQAIAAGERIVGHVARGTWRELSTIRRYLDESIRAARVAGGVNVVGESSRIDPAASVVDSVLWKGVRIDAGAVVERCVVGDNVEVAAGEVFRNAVIVRAEIVREIERGRVEGDRLVAPIEPVLD